MAAITPAKTWPEWWADLKRDHQNEIALPRKGMLQRDGLFNHLLKWIFPMMFAMLGFYIQSVGLHYATYQYVQHMLKLPEDVRNNFTYSVLPDPVADKNFERMTGANAWLHVMDGAAACFPFIFMVISAFDLFHGYRALQVHLAENEENKETTRSPDQVHTLQTFTKVMICAGLLFMLKGILGAVTTVPDSSGWAVCKDRLTNNNTHPDGLIWMSEGTHGLSDMFSVDFVFNVHHGHPLRYCSDMMYSGHTFVVTLFALGFYEQLRTTLSVYRHWLPEPLRASDGQDKEAHNAAFVKFKMVCLGFFACVAIGEQILEIYFVEKTHFHYTMDVLMAIVVVFLFFTNGAIVIFARQWEQRGCLFFIAKYPLAMKYDDEYEHVEEKDDHEWISRGDLFIPPCCFPCCCLSGREHLYSDSSIFRLFKKQTENACPICQHAENKDVSDARQKLFVQEMNLFDGLSSDGFLVTVGQGSECDLTQSLLLTGA